MNNYAWILCSKEKKAVWWKNGWLGNILYGIYLSLFAKPQILKIYPAVKEVCDDSKTEGYLIRLPCTKKELQTSGSKGMSRMASKISLLIKDNDIVRLYPEPFLLEMSVFRDEMTKKDILFQQCGYDLFVSLTGDMLSFVSEKKRKSIGKTEIVIIAGNDLEALKTLILKLAGTIGLVTIAGDIAGDQNDELEKWLENICDETGLCVRTTRDIKNAVKDCDIIISFEEKPDFSRYKNLPVIWFGRKDGFLTKPYEFYPYRIEIEFPAILYNHYTQELVSCFGSLGIAEVFIDPGIIERKITSFPEVARINLLRRQLYDKMEEIRYIRKPLE